LENLPEKDRQVAASVQQCLRDSYDLDAVLTRLPGENLNYLAVVENGEKYVVKIAADDQSEAFVEMEFLALEMAGRELSELALPKIQENKFGYIESFFVTGDSSRKRLRIIDYLSGSLLANSDISEEIRVNIGKTLAEFDLAVASFDHPAAHRLHRWDLTQANQHFRNLSRVADPVRQALLSWAQDQYTKNITGNIGQVSWQFIHGDPNPENILIDGDRVVGLLDFGDSCFNPRICELAICLPYLMMEQEDPIAVALPVVRAYSTTSALSSAELQLLWPLILGRLATTINVATARRQLDPDHPNWFVSEQHAWSLLEHLRDLRNPFV